MAKSKDRNIFKRAWDYCVLCYEELRYKVTWPTKKELSSSAVIVLVASVILSLFIFLVDQAFEFIMGGIYRFII